MSDTFPPPPPEQPQPRPEPRHQASPPSPWTVPAAPPRKQRTGLIVTLAVGGGLVVAGTVAALAYALMESVSDPGALSSERSGTPYSAAPAEPAPPPPEPAPAEPEAEEDVTIAKCVRDDLIGWPHADLEIVNGTGATAGYVVFVKFVDGRGAVLTDGIATTEGLAPGASSKVRAQGLGEVPSDTECRIDQVQRDPL